MEKKKALTIIGIVGGTIILGLVGVVVVLPKLSSSKADNMKKKEEVDETKAPNGKPNPNASTPINPLGTTDDVKKFQDWMDVKHPNWLDNKTSLNKAFGYGNFGLQTSKAWGKYATEYQGQGNKPTSTSIGTVKTYKAYSRISANPIYSSLKNFFPYKFVKEGEYIGNLTGKIEKLNGNNYLELKFPDNTLKYALYSTVRLADASSGASVGK